MSIKLVRGDSSQLTWSVPLLGSPTDGNSAVENVSGWFMASDRNIAIQSVWTGATSGTFYIDLSNDGVNVAYTMTDADYTIKPAGMPSGGPGSSAASFECDFIFGRIRFYPAAGSSGALNSFVSMKI
jgi:hypothetical protein